MSGKKIKRQLKELEEDRCCMCGDPATVSSEGGSYCHRCAMLYAK